MAIKLIHEPDGREMKPGDLVETFLGEPVTITGWPQNGHNRVWCKDAEGRAVEWFPSVVLCKLVPEQ